MSEEWKPIRRFSANRTSNGGWVISESVDDRLIAPLYAYSSDHDMLAALPELIGVRDDRDQERGKQWYFATEQQNLRAGDGYENGD